MTPDAPPARDLEELYRSMRSGLHGFIASQVRDRAAVDDLLHDVFLKIHAGRNRLRDPARLEAWIYRIARNAVTDWYRRRRRVEPLAGPAAEALAVPEVEEDLVRRLAPSVRYCISRLPADYRRALIESDLKGVPQTELAERLGISYSALKSRVQRARRQVHDMLLACCHFDFDQRGGVIDYRPKAGCCKCGANEESSC